LGTRAHHLEYWDEAARRDRYLAGEIRFAEHRRLPLQAVLDRALLQ